MNKPHAHIYSAEINKWIAGTLKLPTYLRPRSPQGAVLGLQRSTVCAQHTVHLSVSRLTSMSLHLCWAWQFLARLGSNRSKLAQARPGGAKPLSQSSPHFNHHPSNDTQKFYSYSTAWISKFVQWFLTTLKHCFNTLHSLVWDLNTCPCAMWNF